MKNPLNLYMLNLDKQLKQIYCTIKPSTKEHLKRLECFKQLETKIKELYPTSEVKLFGSFYTGLYLSTSDVDVSINLKTNTPNEILQNIRKHLNLNLSSHIRHAKIPILKFKIKNINFDISINNYYGIDAAQYIKENCNSDLKKIVLIFKHYIISRKLGDARDGGLNSYSLYLLILNFYQLYPCKISHIFLFDLIQYYGFVFNYKYVQVDCKNIKYKKNIHNRLSIIDPTNENVDVGNTNKNFDSVVESLQNLYRVILHNLRNKDNDLFKILNIKKVKKKKNKVFALESSVNNLDIK